MSENSFGGDDFRGESEFRAWLLEEVSELPTFAVYNEVMIEAVDAVIRWRRRFDGNPGLWRRIMKPRLIKEIGETAPILDATLCLLRGNQDLKDVTIVDLCSGKGYLSMLLSELAPKGNVYRCLLVDKAWPRSVEGIEPQSHHIDWSHLYEPYSWPIPLISSKQDIKSRSALRSFREKVLDNAPGPLLILAVHLCGTLSLRAVELFNEQPNASFLALKPCCLPPIIHAQRKEFFVIGQHEFLAKDVASNGKFSGNKWIGPPRHQIKTKFDRWVKNLASGLLLKDGGRYATEQISVQVQGGFQNSFLFAQHSPAPVLWDHLAYRRHENLASLSNTADKQLTTFPESDIDIDQNLDRKEDATSEECSLSAMLGPETTKEKMK